ncbi:lycopene beta-cyclase CrtY [Hyphococcus luteus]|uniref:Lycopene cyclase n=1 Tax=Hyphococcus luteus TaxID=2058213 RepID=A0A2S7K4M7_9PROT|nr:lycopene beta-cyclase CrtY [Marinicaulis flavus]PQA87460.1 lycopene cyclase [Marinicaulis flavus]
MSDIDLAILGGGLAGGLAALALHRRKPDLSVALIEAGPRLGGEHTWSFHDTDLTREGMALIEPLISYKWPAQQVKFPAYERRLSTGYNSIASSRFHDVLMEMLGAAVRLEAPVDKASPESVTLKSGETIRARAVLDCRGAAASPHLKLGFQKFVGQELRLAAPHGFDAPVIMDATVPQIDGYRFIYVLPFDERTLLIEDTRYADGPGLPVDVFRKEIADYAAAQGWRIEEVIREEEGVLPIALGGDIDAFWDAPQQGVEGPLARGGMRAGLFHPLTGYSLPDAVALALEIAGQDDLSAPALYNVTRGHSTRAWRERSYYRFLTRMLFLAASPEKRYRVLQRFYKMPEPLIERFYAGRSGFADKARILMGKPPVPVVKAAGVMREESVMGNG